MADLLITLTAHERDSNNVTIAFTMGVKALEKGHSVDVMLLSDAVSLAQKNYADKIDIGDPFKPVSELIAVFLSNGGKLKVCSACMKHNGVEESSLLENAIVINAGDVIDGLMESKKTLQLN